MTVEENIRRLNLLNRDEVIQNFIAQAHSRYILLNTSENPKSYPPYTIDDNNLNILALYYLEIGCSFAEANDLSQAREPMEKGASILEHIHASISSQGSLKNYYSLISALAYYVAFQYSKSFVLISKTQCLTTISELIGHFLKRNFKDLISKIDALALDATYTDDFISNQYAAETNPDENAAVDKIYGITIAKSLNGFVKYFQTGNREYLEKSKAQLTLLKEITELQSEPSMWWIVRLLILISDGFTEASLWASLQNYFDVESDMVKRYIKSLVFLPQKNVYELFLSQRKSLSKVLNSEDTGCIVSIPTSSGKTRIAELAILDSITKSPESKVLYIAPFKSLAFEIESSLDKIFSNVDLTISHLYGGGLFNKIDEEIILESHVIIATPEKAKAIIRSNQEVASKIKLIIIDEGHLLGNQDRFVSNEIFYDELRYHLQKNKGRFLLLSAVLPNSEDIAQWLTQSSESIYKDNWRPSDERLGTLQWNGEFVDLDWKNNDIDRRSFNNKFLVKEYLTPREGRKKIKYPKNKDEAVAGTAYKLRTFGTCLIFVGKQNSVFKMGNAYLTRIDETEDFVYTNQLDWKSYQLACTEIYGINNQWLTLAKKGILCHHGGLNTDVRIPLEKIMRNEKPPVIISTSTLGQGVNLGVSTVIFSTLNQSRTPLNFRDFWNIAGRAGRAFVDHEGKILVALDSSDRSNLFSKIKKFKAQSTRKYQYLKKVIVDEYQKKINQYFEKERIDKATSGVLFLLQELKKVAANEGISFDFLLQLIAENRIVEQDENLKNIDTKLDLIDDVLVSLHELHNPGSINIDYTWIDSFFKKTLAYIQIKNEDEFTREDLIDLFTARVIGLERKIGNNRVRWQSIISSGIPLNSDLFVEDRLDKILNLLTKHIKRETATLKSKITLVISLVKLIDTIPLFKSMHFDDNFYDYLKGWINGDSQVKLSQFELEEKTINEIITYKLPWVLNGISKKLRIREFTDEAELTEELSLLIELGLPNLKAAKIYQSGIRSRLCSTELSEFFDDEVWTKTIKDYKNELIKNCEDLKSDVSDVCAQWLDLIAQTSRSQGKSITRPKPFTLVNVPSSTILFAKRINKRQYLVNDDLTFTLDVTNSTINVSSVSDIEGVYFISNPKTSLWDVVVDNPYVRFDS